MRLIKEEKEPEKDVESDQEPNTQNKKKKVDLEKLVWKHFHVETASNDSDSLVLCNHCDARYHMSVIDVSSMKVHLEVMHQLEIENKSRKPRKRKKTYESKEA